MAWADVRGVRIHYEVLGEQGPWVALSPGGRRGIEGILPIATKVAGRGYRVLVHDRRNCGASDVVIDGAESEYEIWADDLRELLSQLGALPAFVGGSSSGSRLAILFALRHPQAARGLLLWRVTGGRFAVDRLARQYYSDFIEVAERGGMPAVVETEFFRERIAENPANRDRLLGLTTERFIEVMSHWREAFYAGADLPVIGASKADLASIRVPVCVVPGNDRTHPRAVGENAARLLPNSELHVIMGDDMDIDNAQPEAWAAHEDELVDIFVSFLERVSTTAAV